MRCSIMGWQTTVCLLVALQALHAAVCSEYLLPGDLAPRHYDLRFVYDIDPATKFSYYAVADITLTAKKSTSKIILHADKLSLNEGGIKLTKLDESDPIDVVKVDLNATYSFLTLTLDRSLDEGSNYSLLIPFYGNLKNELSGVYISTYVDETTNSKQYLISTQFEAISARKGFPCFDEPLYKATFTITIGHHRNYTAVSNMPLEKSSDDNTLEEYWPWSEIQEKFKKEKSSFVWDQFEKSVPMSTYLVAFVVSKFGFVESPPELSKTKFRIWARMDAINQTQYASSVGPRVLTHFEKWFNVDFPLPKQDMIAIPDFNAGAMENWGLITYRETALLYDPQQSSFLNKERVAEVIAHELAHQWFGNLVTMKWWQDLWLNEGFATHVAALGVAAAEPAWRAPASAAASDMAAVMGLDALESSHPVSVPLDDPKLISEIFDEISYRKGSTLIRMMTMFLGEEVFRKAINRYLVKYSYSNAEQDDLWQELTSVVQQGGGLARNVTVKEVMDTWTTQTGYPLLTVTRDYSDHTVTVTQKRYLALGAKASTSASWWVPLIVLCESEAGSDAAQPVQWLAAGEGVAHAHRFEHAAAPGEWLLFNKDYIAPYRVNYDPRNWQLLSGALRSPRRAALPPLSRVQLISDAFALAWTGQLDYTTAIELASYLQHETELLPLEAGLSELGKIENVLRRSPEYGAFQRYVRRLVAAAYRRSGGLAVKRILDADDLNSVKMQVTLSSWACRVKVPGCEENAMQLFKQWMDTDNPDENNPIPLDLRRTVYCVGASRGSVAEWRFLVERRRGSRVAAARQQLQAALACTRDVWLLAQYLEWTVTEGSEIRRQDAAIVIASVARSTVGYYVARDFLYDRIHDIYTTLQDGSRLGRIIKAVADQFTTQRELDDFLVWREKNQKYLSESKLAIQQAIEKATVNIGWLNKNKKHVVDKMREFSADYQDKMKFRAYSCQGSSHRVLLETAVLYLFCIIIRQNT